MKFILSLQLCFWLAIQAMAQEPLSFSINYPTTFDTTSISKKTAHHRQWLAGSASAAIYAGSFIGLHAAWYQQYPRSSFHTINDNGEWLQMDKVGHTWTAYNTSRATTALWNWAGVTPRQAVWIGSVTGFTYMTVIEWLDGHSAEWGWSWGDMAANVMGASLFASQQLAWQQQRIQFKFSSRINTYEPILQQRADHLFGNSKPERLLKDYNAQSYWLAFNVASFLPQRHVPEWLNIAIGYGANGMYGGYQNIAFDKNGAIVFDRRDISRYRQWYLSADIDFTKIKTNSKWVRTLLTALNAFKLPAPTLEFSQHRIKGHWILL